MSKMTCVSTRATPCIALHASTQQTTPVSEDNKIGIILMTTYANQTQYEKREPHFEELIKEKGALNLMNDLKPNEFRKIVFSKENVIHHD